jgi:hypothetical protein
MPAPTVTDGDKPQPGTPGPDGRASRRLLAVAPVTHPGGAETGLLAAAHEGAKRFYADAYADRIERLIAG